MDTTLLRLIFIQNVKKGKNQPTLAYSTVHIHMTNETLAGYNSKWTKVFPQMSLKLTRSPDPFPRARTGCAQADTCAPSPLSHRLATALPYCPKNLADFRQ
jgi:hypothetical protein